jgi:hypothetical protein
VILSCSLVTGPLTSNAPNKRIEAASFFMFHILMLAKAKGVPGKYSRGSRWQIFL